MTALFPDFQPARRPTPSSLDTLGTTSRDNDSQLIEAPGEAEAAGPVRPRRAVLLRPRARGQDRRDPDAEQAAARRRADLKRDAADALRAFSMHAVVDELPPGLRNVLGDPTPVKRRASAGPSIDSTRGIEWLRWLQGRGVAMDACQEVRAFREVQCGTYAIQPHSCDVRVCPDCERERSARAVRETQAILDTIDPRRRAFIVLTIRNVLQLVDGLDLIDAAFMSLRRRPLFRGGRCRWRLRDGSPGHTCWHPEHPRSRPTLKGEPNVTGRNCPLFRHRPVAGGVRFTEVTYSVDARTWHPHLNVLADSPFIAQAELADTWRACTCTDRAHRRRGWCSPECDLGSSVVWIRQVDPDTVREAVKYVTKASDLIEGDDPMQLIEFLVATRGRRLAQGFGSFFGLKLDEPEDDRDELVELAVVTDEHDRLGRPIVIRFRLPRFCRHCGRDTKIDDEHCTYEPPVWAKRVEVRLRNGAPSWRPPGGGSP